ncbi:nucleotide-binding protein [Candidatus Woesearchaeota archaeon]|nr:nucleotide-binding protein [Candidatus Woesearchaeota archaeon]
MNENKKMARKPNRPFPLYNLEASLVIAQAIQDNNAGKPMKRLLLADAIGRKPTTIQFRDLLSSSYKYGLTLGTEKADYIELTKLGKDITKPISPQQHIESKQKAVLTVPLFKSIYTHYNNAKYPKGTFFENTLEVEFNVPREYLKEVIEILDKNGRFSGLIRDISGSPMVMFDDYGQIDIPQSQEENGISTPVSSQEESENLSQVNELEQAPQTQPKEQQRPIFIAHGKDKKPLEQLKKILDQFQIPYKVAVDEPHSGRPISQKIRELMNSCGSAIFIFSKDGESKDKEVGVIVNLNAVFELGAASVLYGEKVIILKEEELQFPSDFNNIGHISFEGNHLDAKALELIRELVAMGSVKIVST